MISPTLLYRGTVAASATTVATTVGNGTTTVNSIVATNKTANARVFSITVGGIYLAYLMPIAPNQTITLDVRQVCLPSTVIQAWADAASAVDVAISGAVQTGIPYIGSGTGSPEGVITANVTSEWLQTDDSQLGNMKWVKLSGTGNTGWYPDFQGRWKTYTPTLSGWTIGTTGSSTACRYTQTGKDVVMSGKVVLGTGFAISGTPAVSLPATANNTLSYYGVGNYTSASVNNWIIFPRLTATTFVNMIVGWSNYNAETGQSSTIPFTWKATDMINFSITYEAA